MSAFVLVKFPNPGTVADALNELKSLRADGAVNVQFATVLARDLQGALSIQDLTTEGPGASAAGALVGGLAGLPLGPAATVIGAASGALIGVSAELIDRQDRNQLVDETSRDLAPGTRAIIAEIDDSGLSAFEAAMERIGGTIIRK